MMTTTINYKCKECSKVYKTWEDILKHKKVTSHLGIEVIES